VKVAEQTKAAAREKGTSPAGTQGRRRVHAASVRRGVRRKDQRAGRGRHLKSGHRHDRHSTAYYGVAPSVFEALVKRWLKSRPSARVEEFTFVDVGAGMGRAMLLAARMPFRAVVGAELNPALAKIAQRNLVLWRRRVGHGRR